MERTRIAAPRRVEEGLPHRATRRPTHRYEPSPEPSLNHRGAGVCLVGGRLPEGGQLPSIRLWLAGKINDMKKGSALDMLNPDDGIDRLIEYATDIGFVKYR